jgi:NitT/TauT family transport system ATP-binding protein
MIETSVGADRGVALRLHNVRRAFGDLTVIDDLTLNVDAGEFLAILGPSGCGKSTLLRLLARLNEPDAGTVNITPSDSKIQTAYVFQDAHLLPWLTVRQNAVLPLELTHADPAEHAARVSLVLSEVGLTDAESLYPSQLSGGMRMRVSLARALVTQPRLLLLDEPFAALDEITRFRLEVRLRELWIERRITVVLVTHSITEAAFLANRAVVLSRRGCHVKLDRHLALPQMRDNTLRLGRPFADEMHALLGAMDEEA